MIEVDKIDLRQLKWEEPDDWTQLVCTATSYTGQPRVCKEDVLRFFDYKIHEIARKANLPFEEAKKVIYEENSEFLSYLDAIFDGGQVYKINSDKIMSLRRFIILPLVEVSVRQLYYSYRSLSSSKREEFRKTIIDENCEG